MDIEHKSIERLKMAAQLSESYYQAPLVIMISGGKDSDVCLALARASGIRYEVQHNHTTADASETVYYVRKQLQRLEVAGIKCTLNRPTYQGKPVSMWSLIPQKLLPPTRGMRYCCDVLKETGGAGRMITTGVRWAESIKRKTSRGIYETLPRNIKKIVLANDNDDARRLFENCTLKAKRVCNPIVDWEDDDIWAYIQSEHINTNPLYECGFARVGCIGCPLAGRKHRQKEFRRYPTYKSAYIQAFDAMLAERFIRGKLDGSWRIGTTGVDVYHWWMEDGVLPGQLILESVV